MAMLSQHTLVETPVGSHVDVFADDGTDGIENKVILVVEHLSDHNNDVAQGRGGCGPKHYCIALLD